MQRSSPGCYAFDEAAAMKKEVLEKRRQILSEEHLDTISAMNNLANTLGDQGQLDEATAMFKEVLEKMKQILGEEHPNTKVAMRNLASLVNRQASVPKIAGRYLSGTAGPAKAAKALWYLSRQRTQ
jgi:hypothetical protein